jgi:hypothetical protein
MNTEKTDKGEYLDRNLKFLPLVSVYPCLCGGTQEYD